MIRGWVVTYANCTYISMHYAHSARRPFMTWKMTRQLLFIQNPKLNLIHSTVPWSVFMLLLQYECSVNSTCFNLRLQSTPVLMMTFLYKYNAIYTTFLKHHPFPMYPNIPNCNFIQIHFRKQFLLLFIFVFLNLSSFTVYIFLGKSKRK